MTSISGAEGLSQVGQVAIRAKDLARSVAFYRNVLGIKFLFQVPSGPAFFDCNGVRLMLDIPEPEFDHPSSIIYFKVGDIHGTFERMRRQGVQFRIEPHVIAHMEDYDLWMAFFLDSEENTLALMSEVPH